MILIFVAEPPIPQRVYRSLYMLRMWFRNTFGHLPICYGMSDSATHWEVSKHIAEPSILQLRYGCVYTLRNGWFQNKNSWKIPHS